jgi:hypothetical protein
MFFTKRHAEIIKEAGHCGQPYRPANGNEGDIFHETYCGKCKKWDSEDGCMISTSMFFLNADEEGYPNEIIYNDNGQPTCTAFVWDAD